MERVWAGDVPDGADAAASGERGSDMRNPYEVTVAGIRCDVRMQAWAAEQQAKWDAVALAAIDEFKGPRTLPVLVRAVYPDFIIFERVGAGTLHRARYTIGANGRVAFGGPRRSLSPSSPRSRSRRPPPRRGPRCRRTPTT